MTSAAIRGGAGKGSDDDEQNKEQVKQSVCLRTSGNYGSLKNYHLADHPAFDAGLFEHEVIKMASPKLRVLLDKINRLDAEDLKKDGTLYKHMIFTDLENSRSIKLIAGGLLFAGFKPCFRMSGTGFGVIKTEKLAAKKRRNNSFGVLASKKWADKTMSVRFKKALLAEFNSRPDNTHGKLIRIVVLDNGYKEGIDLYDVKYVHLFDPMLPTDEQQAIGRGTRFCGQMGLKFIAGEGWPLHVFKYDSVVDAEGKRHSINEAWIHSLDLDMRKLAFAADIDRLAAAAAVDRALTEKMHANVDYSKVPLTTLQKRVAKDFAALKYDALKVENKCAEMSAPPAPGTDALAPITSLSQTQQFVSDYFKPTSPQKGMLVYSSVGSGKACLAVATATHAFQRAGYTILFVTRTTLKADIWKNITGKIMCHEVLKERIDNGIVKKYKSGKPSMTLAGKEWLPPLSYKQFTNMLSGENQFYYEMTGRNGKKDPLRKTLLIIDEAHKLYSGTSKASEQPDMEELEQWIQSSYKKSGKDSVRVLLMTGTPIVSDGMELVKLVNLLRPVENGLPTEFDEFAQKYLDKTGVFTASGRDSFMKNVDGHISYLNRSADTRYFAKPVFDTIEIPMPEYDKDNSFTGISYKSLREAKASAVKDAVECRKEVKVRNDSVREEKKSRTADCMDISDKKKRAQCKEQLKEWWGIEDQRIRMDRDGCNNKALEAVTEFENRKALVQDKRDDLKDLRETIKDTNESFREAKDELKAAKKQLLAAKRALLKKFKEMPGPQTKETKAAYKASRIEIEEGPKGERVKEATAQVKSIFTQIAEQKQEKTKLEFDLGLRPVANIGPLRKFGKCGFDLSVIKGRALPKSADKKKKVNAVKAVKKSKKPVQKAKSPSPGSPGSARSSPGSRRGSPGSARSSPGSA